MQEIMKDNLDEIDFLHCEEAQALADEIGKRVSLKEWRQCDVEFVDEKRKDRCADTAFGPRFEIRLFQGGQDVGTLLHEMAHNSIFCLKELMLMYGLKVSKRKKGQMDDAHGLHHDTLFKMLEEIYNQIKKEE